MVPSGAYKRRFTGRPENIINEFSGLARSSLLSMASQKA
jgi:hypothetical protein